MDWKDRFNRATEHIKNANNRVTDNVKQKATNKLDLAKNRISHSTVGQFAKEKGLKNKAKFVGRSALNKVKDTNAFKKAQNLINGAKKVIQFIINNIIPIGISLLVIVVGSNLAIIIVGIAQSLGETPHYYCTMNPSNAIRDSKEYRQYCGNDVSYIDLKQINGHYIVQDGPGPCTSCSMLNLLIRFYDISDVNLYDYLWQSNGQYTPAASNIVADSADQYNMRRFMNGGSSLCNTDPWRAKIPNVGSQDFAKNFGKEGYTMANWGYLRDPTITGESAGYDELANNENWVWDLSLDNDASGTDWECYWGSGRQLVVEGTTATFVHETRAFRAASELQILLDAHPAGIVIYRDYGSGNHAILITGYDAETDTYKVVDPALGVMGGFEVDADSCVTADGATIFSNEILRNPTDDNNILSFTYIEEG